MIVRISILASLLVISTLAFECSPDTILRMATNKREKQLERECHEQKTNQDICATKDELEKSWKEFQDVSDKYKEAVTACRNYVQEKSRPKRAKWNDYQLMIESEEATETPSVSNSRSNYKDGDGRLYETEENAQEITSVYETIDHPVDETKEKHRHHRKHLRQTNKDTVDRQRRSDPTAHDPNDPNIDHSGHEHRRRRHNDDPNDDTIDHTGHNHRIRRSKDHDPNDPNQDHTGHNHRRRRQNDDPNDPTIDHSGHNHRVKRSHDDDPNDTTIDHTGHNHRMRRSDDHDPNDPNIDHSGHNHRRRRHHVASRIRRTVCSTAGQEQLSKMSTKFSKHCERENICLPDEDLPKGKQQDDIIALQKLRAKKYSDYLTQVSKCYGKL